MTSFLTHSVWPAATISEGQAQAVAEVEGAFERVEHERNYMALLGVQKGNPPAE